MPLTDNTDARSELLRLHQSVQRREPGHPNAALSPEELLLRFRATDPTRNGSYLPWLIKTYASGGYRLEDLSKAHDTLVAFARFRQNLPDTAIINDEVRNPRRLGSHVTLASLWSVIVPFIEAERIISEAKEVRHGGDSEKKRAVAESRIILRSERMVIAVPMTQEASCWWGQGTQWCTAARKNNFFWQYHTKAPLIIVCLRKNGDLPARKLQLHVHASGMQFRDENDARISQEIIFERWQDLEALLHWAVTQHVGALDYVPEYLRTEAMCLDAVRRDGRALYYVPKYLRAEAICLAAVKQHVRALDYVPKALCTETMYLAAVGENGPSLQFIPERLHTEAMCLIAVGNSGRALEYVSEPLRTEAICLAAVEQYGYALEYVPSPLRTKAMCTVAVGRHGQALKYMPEPLRTEAMCTAAVMQDGWALAYVPEPSRTEVVCLAAVCSDGYALPLIPEALRTEALCVAAVGSSHGGALVYVPQHLRTEAMCLDAVGRDGRALCFVPEHLRTEAVCSAAKGSDTQKYKLKTNETDMHKLQDLALESLGNYLNKLPLGRQDAVSPSFLTAISRKFRRWLCAFKDLISNFSA